VTAPAGNRDVRAEFPHLIGATTVTNLTPQQVRQAGVVAADQAVTKKLTETALRDVLQMLGLIETDGAS